MRNVIASVLVTSLLGSGFAISADPDRASVGDAVRVDSVGTAEAQVPLTSTPVIRHSWPYVAVGLGTSPCGSSTGFHAAIGRERIFQGGLGFGGEIGVIADSDHPDCNAGVGAFHALLHFKPPLAP